tara:strand:+ start:44 stop:259 length:216 start_codon:yes stop_codon:yes gene_type:complete
MKPPHACYYLENKSYFIPPPAGGFEDPEEPLGTGSWCLRTHEAVGPDGHDACPGECNRERACYQPEVDLEN